MSRHHIYTYGTDSIQFMILTEEEAALINKFATAFSVAQKNFEEINNRPWTPTDAILFTDWTYEENDAYGELTKRLNLQHKIRNEMFDDFSVDVSDEPVEMYLVKR